MSHYHYVTLLKRYSQIFLRWKVLSVKIVQFLWGQNHIILLKKSLNSFSESNFAQDSFQMSNVTLSHQPIWQTVQIHVLGHNFFIWGPAWTYDISTCSVWRLWEFQCIFLGLNWQNKIVKPKKLKVIVWQQKFESHITFFKKPNKTYYYQYCK